MSLWASTVEDLLPKEQTTSPGKLKQKRLKKRDEESEEAVPMLPKPPTILTLARHTKLFRVAHRIPTFWHCPVPGCCTVAPALREGTVQSLVCPNGHGAPRGVAMEVDGVCVVTLSGSSSVRVHEMQMSPSHVPVPALRVLCEPTESRHPHRLAVYFPLVAVGMREGSVHIFDCRTGALVSSLPEPQVTEGDDTVWMVMWQCLERLYVLHGDTTVRVWSVSDSGRELKHMVTLNLAPDPSSRFSCELYYMTADGNTLVTGHDHGLLRVCNVVSNTVSQWVRPHMLTTCRVDLVGHRLVTGSFDGRIRLWDVTPATAEPGSEPVVTMVKSINIGSPVTGMSRFRDHVALVTMNPTTGKSTFVEVWDTVRGVRLYRYAFPVIPTSLPGNNSSLWFDGRNLLFTTDDVGAEPEAAHADGGSAGDAESHSAGKLVWLHLDVDDSLGVLPSPTPI